VNEIVSTVLDGRIKIKFAPASVKQRADAWQMRHELKDHFGDEKYQWLEATATDFSIIAASIVDMSFRKFGNEDDMFDKLVEWWTNRKGKTATEWFEERITLPDQYWNHVVEAFENQPNYVPIEQRPVDKLPPELQKEALDPKAKSGLLVGNISVSK
jgi:hypothetical protein